MKHKDNVSPRKSLRQIAWKIISAQKLSSFYQSSEQALILYLNVKSSNYFWRVINVKMLRYERTPDKLHNFSLKP